MDALADLQLLNSSLVVLTSDHGMHVGEKGMWEKYTLFEETTRVPYLVSDPRYPSSWGGHHTSPVEMLSLVPTIVDLLGINRTSLCGRMGSCVGIDGKSLAHLVRNDSYGDAAAAVRDLHIAGDLGPYAVSQMTRCRSSTRQKQRAGSRFLPDAWDDICSHKSVRNGSVIGYSLRSRDWRYTSWLPYDGEHMRPHIDALPLYEELYDHRGAPVHALENEVVNLLGDGRGQREAAVSEALSVHRFHLIKFLNASIFGLAIARKKYLSTAEGMLTDACK